MNLTEITYPKIKYIIRKVTYSNSFRRQYLSFCLYGVAASVLQFETIRALTRLLEVEWPMEEE